jgi:hypothetical protein
MILDENEDPNTNTGASTPTNTDTLTSSSSSWGMGGRLGYPLLVALAGVGLACASGGPTLLAAGQPMTDVPRAEALPSPARARVPEYILRDPAQRMMFLERMRVQILNKTRSVPPASYATRVRPSLDRQLRALGIDPLDIAWILEDVDRSRASARPTSFAP